MNLATAAMFVLQFVATCVWVITPPGSCQTNDQFAGLTEYCQWESFNATCKPDEVVVIEKALYGRMQNGRCTRRDYGYIGCYRDVTSLVENRCSGHQHCSISVPDKHFDRITPCAEDLKLHMMANYSCLQVATPKSGRCHATVATPLYTSSMSTRHYESSSTTQVLSSRLISETGCGSPQVPWIVEVLPGQRISLSLIDFTGGFSTSGSSNYSQVSGHCQVYAIVKETKYGKSETICGSPWTTVRNVDEGGMATAGDRRERSVYVSIGHVIEIRFMATGKAGQYLLKYDAVGCPDLTPPVGGWWRREGDGQTAAVGCGLEESSESVFYWVCQGNRWLSGDGTQLNAPINCSNSYTLHETYSAAKQLSLMSHAVVLVIIISMATCIGVLMLTVGLCIIKRRRTAMMLRGSTATTAQPIDDYFVHHGIGGNGGGLMRSNLSVGATAGTYLQHHPSNFVAHHRGPGPTSLQHQLSYTSGKDGAVTTGSCCSGSDGNDYAYVEDLLYAAATTPGSTSGGGSGHVGLLAAGISAPVSTTAFNSGLLTGQHYQQHPGPPVVCPTPGPRKDSQLASAMTMTTHSRGKLFHHQML